MKIKISVVVPTYNRPSLLSRCLSALLNQSFLKNDYEIIIVSDGMDTATRERIESFITSQHPVICFYSLTEKKGPASARNAGWRKASGELIAFTDDDCIPDSKWLESLWSNHTLSRNNKLAAYTGRLIVPIPPNPTDYELNIRNLENADFITANCACTKRALELVEGFDETYTMAWREDSDLQFKFMEKGVPIYSVSNAIVTHPVRKAVWGISIKEERKGMFDALLYKKYPRLFRDKIQSSPLWLYYFMISFCFLFLTGLVI